MAKAKLVGKDILGEPLRTDTLYAITGAHADLIFGSWTGHTTASGRNKFNAIYLRNGLQQRYLSWRYAANDQCVPISLDRVAPEKATDLAAIMEMLFPQQVP